MDSTMPGLAHYDDGGAPARCKHCGVLAVGPCARCREPVCGNCCVLTEGGATTWAICLGCDRRGGHSLRAGWLVVLAWFASVILILIGAVVALQWLFPR